MLMKHNLKKNEKKKKVVFINGWRKMCSMVLIFSMAVSLGAGYVSSQRVEAKAYDTSMSQFNKQYLDTNTFTVKGEAYLVGTDNVAKIGSTQTVYSVPEGTKIQGKTIKSKYLPQDNNQTVKYIWNGSGNVKKYTGKSIVIKGLKPNTTYYFRQRYKAAGKTDAGTKYLIAPWSKSLKIKTLAK